MLIFIMLLFERKMSNILFFSPGKKSQNFCSLLKFKTDQCVYTCDTCHTFLQMARELLDKLGLEKFSNVIVHKYSGGTKRKLALAVALLGDPPILYLVSFVKIKKEKERQGATASCNNQIVYRWR